MLSSDPTLRPDCMLGKAGIEADLFALVPSQLLGQCLTHVSGPAELRVPKLVLRQLY